MTRPVEFAPEALEELDEGARWFQERHEGLGARFVAEARAVVASIPAAPESCSPVAGAPGIRSARLKGFRYRVYFVERSDTIRIITIAHTSRRPRSWRGRLR